MKRPTVRALIGCGALLTVLAIVLATSAHADHMVDGLEKILQAKRARVGEMRGTAKLIIGIAVAVAMAGAATSVLQAFKEVWARWVAGLVGIVVAGLTAFSNLSFSEDHRALRLKADRSDVILDRVELSLTHLAGLEEEDQRVLIDQVYADFRDLQRVFEGETSVTALGPTSSIGLSAPAWAAGTAPEWIKGQAADPKSVYFVGLGSAPSLAQARDESRRRAVADARTWLAEALKKSATPPDEIASLSDRAAGSATVVDTWFERGNDGNFRFFTLVRLSRAAAATDFRVFAAREQVQLPSSAYNSVQKDSGRSADYVANRQQTYEQLLTKTRSELGDDYAKLEEGRRLRREGRIDEAIAVLTPIAERRPDAFVVWFNLGLAHASRARRYQAVADAETMQRERRAAESAYRRALALEPDQPVRDPSVYNSFGSFLLDTGREQEAIPLFERALELDASHALAARNLAAAKQKLAPPGP